jgi:tetratricopeptide (TPR) repeat protein
MSEQSPADRPDRDLEPEEKIEAEPEQAEEAPAESPQAPQAEPEATGEKAPESTARRVGRIVLILFLLGVIFYSARIAGCGWMAYQALKKADVAHDEGNLDEAIRLAEKVRNYPGRYKADVRERLGFWYSERGHKLWLDNKHEEAAAAFRQALESGGDGVARRQLLNCYLMAKEYEKAREVAREILQETPDDQDAKRKLETIERVLSKESVPAESGEPSDTPAPEGP